MAITYHAGRRIQATNSDRAFINRGTIDTTSSPNNTIITFIGDGTFTPTSSFNVEYLVVAGGGAGGAGWRGGGGGAGGYLTATGHAVTAQNYTITVGAGGTGTIDEGNNGSDSVFSTITSTGGGGGGGRGDTTDSGLDGGSGGGGNGNWSAGSVSSGGSATASPSQGNAGGAGVLGSVQCGGGGGGAGAVGEGGGSGGTDGDGGAGVSSSIRTGSSVPYAGGGGGGNYGTGNTTVGGTGGGGAGSRYIDTDITGYSGTANTGGGGGGTGSGGAGGTGGSGIVIIKFVTSGNTYDTSLGDYPLTNVQVGSRLEETDTRKMYHYTYDWFLEGTTIPPWSFTDNLSSSTPWTSVGSGITVTGGEISMAGVAASGSNYLWRTLDGHTLSDTLWTMEFDYKSTGQSGGSVFFPFGVKSSVSPLSPNSGDSLRMRDDTDNAYLGPLSSTVGGADSGSTASIAWTEGSFYYPRIGRTNSTTMKYQLFSDAARTTQVGSTLTATISSSITGLDTLVCGGGDGGGGTSTGKISNIYISESDLFT